MQPDKVMFGHEIKAQVGLSFAPFLSEQCAESLWKRDNPARHGDPEGDQWLLSLSLTQTNLNNSRSRWWEGSTKIEKIFPFPKRWASIFLHKQPKGGKVLLQRFHHSDTEIQSLDGWIEKVYTLIYWERLPNIRKQNSCQKTVLSSDTLAPTDSRSCGKVAKQIKNAPPPKPPENIYTWRRGSRCCSFQSELEIEHLGLITCDKIQSKNIHFMPWTTTQ